MIQPPNVRSLWGKKIFEILSDGEWHEYEKTLGAAMRVVPPGVATRKTERMRVASLPEESRQGHKRKSERTLDELVRIGQRAIARQTLDHYVAEGTIEREDKKIRLLPLDYYGIAAVARECKRPASVLAKWMHDEDAIAEVRALLPPDVEPIAFVQRGESWYTAAPHAAVPAWVAFANSRRRVAYKLSSKAIAESLAEVLNLTPAEARDLFERLDSNLRKRKGYALVSRDIRDERKREKGA